MFLDLLTRRNPAFIEAAIELHQSGKLPPNCYVLDLDAIEANSKIFSEEAAKYNLTAFAMTKQIGRHSGACQAIMRGGISRSVAVDMACATACTKAGLKVGHLGHLVQVPRYEAAFASKHIAPDYWTVFSHIKAQEAANAAKDAGRVQSILARIQTSGDTFYKGHEGGFNADDILAIADRVDALEGGEFAGVTTFPALLFDRQSSNVEPTQNLHTINKAAEALCKAGRGDVQVNAPGTNSAAVLSIIANAGATQCEPGNALHGTTPLHAVRDLPETPAALYLSEVSHHYGDRAYCFGGGLYVDPVFSDYDVKAIVSSTPTTHPSCLASVELPDRSMIDYYGMIDAGDTLKPRAGDSVIFGFRGQAFVTRAWIAGVKGIAQGSPKVSSIENIFGQQSAWPNQR